MLQDNRLVGLLRLDVVTIFVMRLYYLLFWGPYNVLNKTNAALPALTTLLAFAGYACSCHPFGFLLAFAQRQIRSRPGDGRGETS